VKKYIYGSQGGGVEKKNRERKTEKRYIRKWRFMAAERSQETELLIEEYGILESNFGIIK